jgi:hypothetical protein
VLGPLSYVWSYSQHTFALSVGSCSESVADLWWQHMAGPMIMSMYAVVRSVAPFGARLESPPILHGTHT